MTAVEDQVRRAFEDMAEDVAPVHFLSRLDRAEHRTPRMLIRRRTAVVAAAVVTTVATGSVLLLRLDQPSIVEPVQRPPKVFRISGDTSLAPGRALMAVTLARPNLEVAGGEHEDALYVLPETRGAAVYLPGSNDQVPYAWTKELSADGAHLIRENDNNDVSAANLSDPLLELVDLKTGRSDGLAWMKGHCPQLSPDNATVAAYGESAVRLFDVGSLTSRRLYRVSLVTDPLDPTSSRCVGLGWSPDGRQLIVRADTGSVIIDRRGTVQRALGQRYAVNSSMSWSPDGRLLLVYDPVAGDYEIVATDVGTTVVLHTPKAAQRPLGWAGERVVWLAGEPGEHRLVTTDQRGKDVRTWMAFDIGDRAIATVSWSRDLSGTAAE